MTELFRVSGLEAASVYFFISKHFDQGLIVLPGSTDLESAQEALQFFLGEEAKVLIFPAFERVYEPVRQDPQNLIIRLRTQAYLVHSKPKEKLFILTSREALSQKTLAPAEFKKSILVLKRGDFIERDYLIGQLEALGYRKDDIAEDQGFFSLRGHLIDIFSPYADQPYRVEFFGDELISIRNFDPETQRSLEDLESIQVGPAREVITSEEKWKKAREILKNLGDEEGILREDREKLLSDLELHRDIVEPRWVLPAFSPDLRSALEYLPSELPVIFVDRNKGAEEYQDFLKDENRTFEELEKLAFGPEKLRDSLKVLDDRDSHELQSQISPKTMTYQVLGFETLRNRLLQSKSFVPLADRIRELHDQGMEVEIVYSSEKRREAMIESLSHLSAAFKWVKGPVFEGFSSSTFRRAFLTERDIFGVRKKRSALVAKNTQEFLRQFSDLKDGDYVVHEDHGIGKFHGLQKLAIQGVESEFLVIEYAESDKLYLPIYRVDKLARYVGEGFANPRLDKLGSVLFAKRKAKIRKDILELAHELLQVAAARKLEVKERPASIDKAAYRRFTEGFGYELTPDQETSIADIEKDLQSPYPMDRLVCGDVGFGKTEVALRAAILAVLQNKQVAVLAPTTILVEQHYRNFQKRFRDVGIEVVHLSRFVSASDQNKILEKVLSGTARVVIGTHRLLQADIRFADLGLLIIDEEQRFGVKHKERIKKMRARVDILTLSATPIPRTLQMSIFGIRDLSLITTPPENREAVKTFVGTFDDALIRRACVKELERGGQILFVHNRVQSIDALADRLKKLLPEIKVTVAHGQMHESELEERIMDFIERRADLLLSTSIIENGLDIPNANTLIVDRAELFGLSDLYQLRGRVGRTHRSAAAYFLIREDTVLSNEASKRLQVLQSYTALGSGFHIATHDMEIRGSGNLLGEEQSGIIAEVGLEFYSQMLQETLSELKQTGSLPPLTELNSGYSAYIPETYIPDASLRISTYKALNRVRTPGELLEMESELLDRFGLAPRELENLTQLIGLRTVAQALKAQVIDVFPAKISLLLSPETPLAPEKIVPLVGKTLQLDSKGRMSFTFKSAFRDPSLLPENSKFKSHPELYDFAQCRQFLKMLCEKSNIAVENI